MSVIIIFRLLCTYKRFTEMSEQCRLRVTMPDPTIGGRRTATAGDGDWSCTIHGRFGGIISESIFRFLLSVLLVNVGKVEKVCKQNGVRDVNEERYDDVVPPDAASYSVHPEEDGDEIDTHAHKHLRELKDCYDFRNSARRVSAACFHSVIGVHDGMYKEVEESKPQPRTYGIRIAVPAVHKNSHVMVIVEKGERRFTKNDKYRVE